MLLDHLLTAVRKRAHHESNGEVAADRIAQRARNFVADVCGLAIESVEVHEFEALASGYRVRLRSAGEGFVVETDERGDVLQTRARIVIHGGLLGARPRAIQPTCTPLRLQISVV
jgi:hypothetical protein